MINEYYNLTGWEVQLATPTQNQQSHILTSIDTYLHAKTIKYQLISSREIDS